ncbi:MAG: hypothetical protein WBA74_25840 [Cyclobacteriaceae bacterium]
MSKLEKIAGKESFRQLPVTIQLTVGKPLTKIFQYSQKAVPADFYQTQERAISLNTRHISRIIKPTDQDESEPIF